MASQIRRSWVMLVTTAGSKVRRAFSATLVGALEIAADRADDTVVETCATVVDMLTSTEAGVDVSTEALTTADVAVLSATVMVESAVLSDVSESVALESAVLSEVRVPATPVPIATDSAEFDSVAEDRAPEIEVAFDEAREALVDSDPTVLVVTDISATAVLREPEVLTKSELAEETCAEVGEPASSVSVESAADSDTLVLIVLETSIVTVLRSVLTAV